MTSEKKLSRIFNPYHGKIVNLAEFENNIKEYYTQEFSGPMGRVKELSKSFMTAVTLIPKSVYTSVKLISNATAMEKEMKENGVGLYVTKQADIFEQIGKDTFFQKEDTFFNVQDLMKAMNKYLGTKVTSKAVLYSVEKCADKKDMVTNGSIVPTKDFSLTNNLLFDEPVVRAVRYPDPTTEQMSP